MGIKYCTLNLFHGISIRYAIWVDIGYSTRYSKVVETSTKDSSLLIVGEYISRPLVRNHYSEVLGQGDYVLEWFHMMYTFE